FWATWCAPCLLEVVRLDELHRRLSPRATVLAVNVDEAAAQTEVRSFASSRGLVCPVVLDPQSRLVARYHPELSLPHTVVLGPEGQVVHRHAGYLPGDEQRLAAELEELLARWPGHPVPPPAALPVPPATPPGPAVSVRSAAPRRWGVFATLLAEQDAQGLARRTFLSRTGADAGWGPLAARARYDLLHFTALDEEGSLNEGTLGLVYLEAGGARWRLRGGDVFPVLGRGLLLHLAPVPALGVESSLRGGLAEGTLGPLSATLLGGVAHVVDTPRKLEGQITTVDNPTAAFALKLQLAHLLASLHGMRTQRPEDAEASQGFAARPGARGVQGLGLWLQARPPLAGLELAGEAVTVAGVDGGQEGHGLYASASLPLGPLHATLEGKRYRALELIYGNDLLTYNHPPTLEPEELFFTLPAGAGEAEGARLLLAATLPGPSLGATCGLAFQRGAFGLRALHGTGSLSWTPPGGTQLELSGGVRREEWEPPFSWAAGSWGHGSLRIVQPLLPGHALEAVGRFQQGWRAEKDVSPQDREAQLAYSFSPYLQLHGRYEHKESERDFLEREDFWAGGVTLRPFSAMLLNFLAGQLPGGRLCSGGTCRTLPGFLGYRLEAWLVL
ncbi:MAG: TlpA family protein disulfide reductase, partial [Deltaproteobacteria bacterium]|nr:TlpA family protein disulfide reductase [Deltaproteobacteria bacterium]